MYSDRLLWTQNFLLSLSLSQISIIFTSSSESFKRADNTHFFPLLFHIYNDVDLSNSAQYIVPHTDSPSSLPVNMLDG